MSILAKVKSWPDQGQISNYESAGPAWGGGLVHVRSGAELQFRSIDCMLKAILARDIMADSDMLAVKQCIRELERATLALGPRWRVKPFGGIANGFASRGSDLDVTCFIEGMEESYRPFAAKELRMQLLPLLQEHPRFEVIDQVWTARVPILKLRFDHRLDVDLSCHNTEALPNTQLLRAYAELSPQVRELGLAIKLWAKEEGVCGAPHRYLSSYSLTLMAIYYMQVDPQVHMPCLSTAHYSDKHISPSKGRVAWACPFSTQVLLARFFRFYASEFQWCSEVVSVRHGKRANATDPAYSQLSASPSSRLHIEDPFLTGRNLHCVLGLEQECNFYAKICLAAQAIQNGRLPDGLRWDTRSLGLSSPVGPLLGAMPQIASLADAKASACEDKSTSGDGTSSNSHSSGTQPPGSTRVISKSIQASSSDSGSEYVEGSWGRQKVGMPSKGGLCSGGAAALMQLDGSLADETPITFL